MVKITTLSPSVLQSSQARISFLTPWQTEFARVALRSLHMCLSVRACVTRSRASRVVLRSRLPRPQGERNFEVLGHLVQQDRGKRQSRAGKDEEGVFVGQQRSEVPLTFLTPQMTVGLKFDTLSHCTSPSLRQHVRDSKVLASGMLGQSQPVAKRRGKWASKSLEAFST